MIINRGTCTCCDRGGTPALAICIFTVAAISPLPTVGEVSRPLQDYVVIGFRVIVSKLRDTDDESCVSLVPRACHFPAHLR